MTLNLPSIPDGLLLLPTVRPREAYWERTSSFSLQTLESLRGHVYSYASLFTPTILNDLILNRLWTEGFSKKLSLDETRSPIQHRQPTTLMEYAAGSQCNYL